LGSRFGELVNAVVMWSASRRVAIREAGGYYGNIREFPKYREALFKRFINGRLNCPLISLRRAEILGHKLVEHMERKSMSESERHQHEAHQRWLRERKEDRKLYREMPDIDPTVIQKGFGFLALMLRNNIPGEEEDLKRYVQEVFEMEMRSFTAAGPGDDRSEISGTPYESDRWVMSCVAKFVARANSVEIARSFIGKYLTWGRPGNIGSRISWNHGSARDYRSALICRVLRESGRT